MNRFSQLAGNPTAVFDHAEGQLVMRTDGVDAAKVLAELLNGLSDQITDAIKPLTCVDDIGCDWSGKSDELRGGEKCPRCGGDVFRITDGGE